jgi:hypothetical protein
MPLASLNIGRMPSGVIRFRGIDDNRNSGDPVLFRSALVRRIGSSFRKVTLRSDHPSEA